MALEHRERQRWVAKIADLNQRINDASQSRSVEPWR